MMEFLLNPIYDRFMELCARSRHTIQLCAPYIKEDVFDDVLDSKNNDTEIDLITKVNLKDFHRKSSDLGAICKTIKNGGRVFNCSNLHAKMYIFDGRKCIITSANLTHSGLKRNAECGLLTDETTVLDSALAFFSDITTSGDVSRITESETTEIASLLQRIPPVQHINYPSLRLPMTGDQNTTAISSALSGWKKAVFLCLGQFDELFTTTEVGIMAQQLQGQYPNNNNREAKIRQVLQQLRDLGLIEFSSPGVYKKLWV
jgi:phosphatidylserine/phosphatidylglycerophosphate/cardiolipin synthase-like enzyme